LLSSRFSLLNSDDFTILIVPFFAIRVRVGLRANPCQMGKKEINKMDRIIRM